MDINNVGKREQRILDIINDVKESKQSVRKYFSTHDVPFSLRQYQSYLKAYTENGINGLADHRKDGETFYYFLDDPENRRVHKGT